jgi:Zn-dependent protease
MGYLQTFTVYLLPVLFAITLHEAAHGFVALHLGDPTASLLGRVSLNPLRHIDPVGTIVVPLAMLAVTLVATGRPFLFGWAKPVPVNFANLHKPKRDMAWVALAGPGANLVMLFIWGLIYKLLLEAGSDQVFFFDMAKAGIFVNVGLMVFNLIPIPPLDGSKVVMSMLPASLAWRYARIGWFGFIIVIALSRTEFFSAVLNPFFDFFLRLVQSTFAFVLT